MSAFNCHCSAVCNGIGSITPGVVTVTIINPGIGCSGNQLASSFRTAVFDRQGASVCNKSRCRSLTGCSNDLVSVKINCDVLTGSNRDRRTNNVNCFVVNHGDRGCGAVGRNCNNCVNQGGIQRIADLSDSLLQAIRCDSLNGFRRKDITFRSIDRQRKIAFFNDQDFICRHFVCIRNVRKKLDRHSTGCCRSRSGKGLVTKTVYQSNCKSDSVRALFVIADNRIKLVALIILAAVFR